MYLPVSRQLLCREINISMNLTSEEERPVFLLISIIISWGLLATGFYIGEPRRDQVALQGARLAIYT